MRVRKPGSWLIPGGLTGGWKYAALWARTQIRADQKVWKAGQGYTPENWNPGRLSVVKTQLSKGDCQVMGQHTGMSSTAGGLRRGPMAVRRRTTTSNHRIVAAVVAVPQVEKVTSGRCIPTGRRIRRMVSTTGQQWIDNREEVNA